jgi:agmatinase
VKHSKPDILIIIDAHLDLKEKFMESNFNHATFARKIIEERFTSQIIYLGTRAYDEEEYIYADNMKHIKIIKTKPILEELGQTLKDKKIYISIDMDSIDPSHMPHVTNPEPNGLAVRDIYDILSSLPNKTIIGGDIMEYAPYSIDIYPAILTSRLILELATKMSNR